MDVGTELEKHINSISYHIETFITGIPLTEPGSSSESFHAMSSSATTTTTSRPNIWSPQNDTELEVINKISILVSERLREHKDLYNSLHMVLFPLLPFFTKKFTLMSPFQEFFSYFSYK